MQSRVGRVTPQDSDRRDECQPDLVNQLLARLAAGDREALNKLLPLVYRELHYLARQHRRRWTGDETLNTTALVHEAYLRLAGAPSPAWRGQPHFMAVASRAMRQVLLDHAKQQHRQKRGGHHARVPLREVEAALNNGANGGETRSDVLIALDDALQRLEQRDPRQTRIVECRFFGGMSIQETGDALGISAATVKRGWAMAQAWLHRELARVLDTIDDGTPAIEWHG
jgi:RNA polymerase sigma factor (TIGR02999 family)